MPNNDAAASRFSFRYTSIGLISHAVKTDNELHYLCTDIFSLIQMTTSGTLYQDTFSLHSLPTQPLALYFTRPTLRPFRFSIHLALILHRPFLHRNSPPSSLLAASRGAAQSIIATPLDSLKVRFEVSDLLERKYHSMYQFATSTLKDLGIASAYRGFTPTLMRVNLLSLSKILTTKTMQDSLACGLFFATFEWVKQQGYYYFLDEIYGYQVNSSKSLHEIKSDWQDASRVTTEDDREETTAKLIQQPDRPRLLLELLCLLSFGAAAVVVSDQGQTSNIDSVLGLSTH